MKSIGIVDAKTNFSKLIERVMMGEELVITKHGESVARLIPNNSNVVLTIKKMAKQMNLKISLTDIKEYKHEGRK